MGTRSEVFSIRTASLNLMTAFLLVFSASGLSNFTPSAKSQVLNLGSLFSFAEISSHFFSIVSPSCPALGQFNALHGVFPVGIGACKGFYLLVDLPSSDHNLHLVSKPGFFDRFNGFLHRFKS